MIRDIIFGLSCHADYVLRIDCRTDDEVSVIDIPYKKYFDDGGDDSAARQERNRGWKYHGGALSPHGHSKEDASGTEA